MAQRRMTSLAVIDTDAFLDMPQSSQLLYFHLNARADDDGFVSSPKKIMRDIGSQGDDLKLLTAKKFIIAFEDGICVIKHWRINNYIRKDIYKESNYLDLKRTLFIKPNGAYTLTDDGRSMAVPSGHFQLEDVKINNVHVTSTSRTLRLGKDRLGKDRLEEVSKRTSLKLEQTINYLKKLPDEDRKEFSNRFKLSDSLIVSKAESLLLYCQSKGKSYKDYRAFLLNALKRDYPEEKSSVTDKYQNLKTTKI